MPDNIIRGISMLCGAIPLKDLLVAPVNVVIERLD